MKLNTLHRVVVAAVASLVVSAVLHFVVGLTSTAAIDCIFLLAVTLCAVFLGRGAAIAAAFVLSVLQNYWFLPPLYTFSIGRREDWVAYLTFIASALIVGQLSAIAEHRAELAEGQRESLQAANTALECALEQAQGAEGLRRSEQVKSALLDAVTHDLRTPLTSIKASVTTLLTSTTLQSETRRDLLRVIDEECDRLDDFIESMIRLANLRSGSIVASNVRCSVAEVIDAALLRLGRRMDQHPVEISNIDGAELQGDPALVAEVMYALLDNAAKYAPPGTPVKITVAEQPAGMIAIDVQDSGPGIPQSERHRIFERFHRSTDRGHGIGMGLAIAKDIAEAHGGSIVALETPHGRGSLFRMSLPTAEHAA